MSLRYSIYKVQTFLFALAHSFCILSHSVSFVKNFFQVFSNFSEVFFARCSREQLRYVSISSRICQALFSSFCKFLSDSLFVSVTSRRLAYTSTALLNCQALFLLFCNLFYKIVRSLFRGSCYFPIVTLHHQSGHNRLRFSYRPLRRIRRCLHHGRQRSYVPADSSAEQLLLWS